MPQQGHPIQQAETGGSVWLNVPSVLVSLPEGQFDKQKYRME